MVKTEILVPLLNANEPEARLINTHVKDGQAVEKGDLLFSIETTKAAADIEAPERGFIRVLAKTGETLPVGFRLAVITDTADEQINIDIPEKFPHQSLGGLRITKPARQLAEKLGVDLDQLPNDKLITENMITMLAGKKEHQPIKLPTSKKSYIVIFGAGGHAKTIMEMVMQIGLHKIAGIVDDNIAAGTQVMGIKVIGTRSILPMLLDKGVKLAANGVGGITDINIRIRIFDYLRDGGFSFPALIHPRAVVEPSAKIGDGVQVFANAYVGTEAVLSPMCMVNTNAVISHDCKIGSYTHIAPGALLAGNVVVGERTLLGMGVTTAIGIKIGSGVRIGNGAILLADVPDRTIVQAGRIWTGSVE
jgi:sugar O-acyltransferase (sialic acid O-acetyltransferase NeuD family)